MANTNAAGVEYLTGYQPDGISLGKDATTKISLYGATPVVQAANVAAATSAVTTTAFNQVLSILSNLGAMAKS